MLDQTLCGTMLRGRIQENVSISVIIQSKADSYIYLLVYQCSSCADRFASVRGLSLHVTLRHHGAEGFPGATS